MPDNIIEAESSMISSLKGCTTSIKGWMDENRLWMNSAKADFILIRSRQQLVKCKTNSILSNDEIVQRSSSIKYLGALIDERLSFKQYITSKCKMAMWNLQKLKAVWSVLTDDVCKTLVSALVLSHLDYANVILSSLPEVDIKKCSWSRTWLQSWYLIVQKWKVLHGVLEVFIGYQLVQE